MALGMPLPASCDHTDDEDEIRALKLVNEVVTAGSCDDPTEFSVSMSNLAECPPDLQRLPHVMKAALHYIAVVDLPASGLMPGEVGLLQEVGLGAAPHGGKDKLTLVMDLDETLVHCSPEKLDGVKHDYCVSFEETQVTGWIYVRPFARLFLEIAARLFEVVVFTASSRVYADQVLNALDPEGECIGARLYREHCTEVQQGFVKDLRRLGRPMEKVVLVDNSPVSIAMNADNGVVVSSWTGVGRDDRELVDLLLLLQQCMRCESVPEFLAQRYGLQAFFSDLRNRPGALAELLRPY